MCRGACNLGTSTIECIKSGGRDLDVPHHAVHAAPRAATRLLPWRASSETPSSRPPRPGARTARADAAARAC